MCIYVNTYICIYMYMYMYIYTYIWICICVYIYVCKYVYICMCIYMCMYSNILCNLYINIRSKFLIYFSRCNAGILMYFHTFLCSKYTYISLKYLHYIWRNISVLTLKSISTNIRTFLCTFPLKSTKNLNN